MPRPLYAARCSPAPAHTRLTSAAPSTMNIHDRQAAARCVKDHGVVHINHVVTSTANESGLVTLTFDLESGVRVTCDVGYLCGIFSLPRPPVLELGPMYATDRRQTKASLNTSAD